MPLKTLFLNPPSFENFDGGAGSRWPATREIEVLLVSGLARLSGRDAGRRAAAGCAAAPRIAAKKPSTSPRTTNSWCCSPALPASPATFAWREAIKDANPQHQDRFRRTARQRAARKVSARLPGHRLRLPQGIRLLRRRIRQGQAARGDSRHFVTCKNGKVVHNPDRPQIQDLDSLPHVTDVYRRDLDVTPLQRAVPAPSVRVALHHARMPGAVHLLPVAADAERTSVAQALHR